MKESYYLTIDWVAEILFGYTDGWTAQEDGGRETVVQFEDPIVNTDVLGLEVVANAGEHFQRHLPDPDLNGGGLSTWKVPPHAWKLIIKFRKWSIFKREQVFNSFWGL